ncbi:MAG TPA: endonuclease Q family protein [Thermodesulfobacteriota bacterium]|nr:endonuclease Q family protein [Thermodesulfobacteriota bacterium]
MRIIADLHVHSNYSRATSRDMTLEGIFPWAKTKGIDIVGTGDFTHPSHFSSIEKKLEPTGKGLFTKKNSGNDVQFMLTAEVSNIYTQGGKTRKIHNLIFAPTLEAARRINSELARRGNVTSDGRPIFGFPAKDLVKIALDADPDSMVIPAHAWTPWFSIFGSKSGFDAIEECFGELSKHVRAIETGLSSDPDMNHRLSALDNITLISNSDAHSPAKLGREANVFDCEMDYYEIIRVLREKNVKKFLFTVEFFPEEGKYHFDGHRACKVSSSPEETKRTNGLCVNCGKGLTIGVLSRVEALADRPKGAMLERAIPSRKLVPLQEIIAESLGRGVNTKAVQKEYTKIIDAGKSEFNVLLDMEEKELEEIAPRKIAEAIMKVRKGEISIAPGFDGEFGKIKIRD